MLAPLFILAIGAIFAGIFLKKVLLVIIAMNFGKHQYFFLMK